MIHVRVKLNRQKVTSDWSEEPKISVPKDDVKEKPEEQRDISFIVMFLKNSSVEKEISSNVVVI